MSAELAVGLALALVGAVVLAGFAGQAAQAWRRRRTGRMTDAERRGYQAALAFGAPEEGDGLWQDPAPDPVDAHAETAFAALAADPLDEPIPVDYIVLDEAFVAREFTDLVARLGDVVAAARHWTDPQPPISPGRG